MSLHTSRKIVFKTSFYRYLPWLKWEGCYTDNVLFKTGIKDCPSETIQCFHSLETESHHNANFFLSLVALQVVITSSVTGHVKVGIVTTHKILCNLKLIILRLISRIDIFNISCEIVLRRTPKRNHWWSFKSGSGNALVPSGNEALPVPMLTQIYVAIWLQ